MEQKETTRCFICIEMPREAIEYIQEIQNLLKKKNLFYGKFTEPENLHLTLKFLGEISEEKIEDVKKAMKKIKFKKFEASLGQLGVFWQRQAGLLWIKLLGKEIWNLQEDLDKELEKIGFMKEERFMSHVTIARMRKISDRKIFLDYIKNFKTKKINFPVYEFILKKSELKSEGPVYTDIERYKL